MNIRILVVLLVASILLTVIIAEVSSFVRIAAIVIWLGMVFFSDPLVKWMSKR